MPRARLEGRLMSPYGVESTGDRRVWGISKHVKSKARPNPDIAGMIPQKALAMIPGPYRLSTTAGPHFQLIEINKIRGVLVLKLELALFCIDIK